MQFEIKLGDLGIAFAANSIAITIIGMFLSWLSEHRELRKSDAIDAVANRLLPFYAAILKSIVRIDLFLITANSVDYNELKLEPDEFYSKASDAFVYITHVETRQLVINIIQILKGLDLVEKNAESERISTILTQLRPLFITLKNLIELYLEEYAKMVKVRIPKMDRVQEMFRVNLELSEEALKSVIHSINARISKD